MPKMNYGNPTRGTEDDSFKWGIRWLIAKRAVALRYINGRYHDIQLLGWWGSRVP